MEGRPLAAQPGWLMLIFGGLAFVILCVLGGYLWHGGHLLQFGRERAFQRVGELLVNLGLARSL